MNYLLQYMRIEFKRAVGAFFSGLASLIIISAIVTGSAAALFTLLQSLGLSEPVKVAIASDDENALPSMALRLMEGMDSIKAVCDFELTDTDSARRGVAEGSYAAAVLLPHDFYNDVNTGINTPAVVLFPENMSGGIKNFGELLQTGVSYIDTVEGGIYAVTDAYLVYGMKVPRGDMEDYLTSIAFDTLLKRTKVFSEEFDNSFETDGLIAYFAVSILLLILIFSCTGFGYLYSKRSVSVEYNFRRVGLDPVKTGIVKLLIMFLQLLILTFIYILALGLCVRLFTASDKESLYMLGKQLKSALNTLGNLSFIIPVLYCICGFVHFIFSLMRGREASGLVLLILFMIMLILGGCIVPSVFLPDTLSSVGAYLPAAMWREDIFGGGAVRELMLGTVFFVLGEGLSCVYTS